ncbi:MAG: NAD-dependent epimerase/dehydratase family protein [bacterium]
MTPVPPGPALITGASGFIGSHVAERLVREGVQVRGLVRSEAKGAALGALGVAPALGDLTDAASLAKAVHDCRLVIHCAAWMGRPWSLRAAEAVNVHGTRALLDAAQRAGVARFIHLSSITVYGPTTAPVIDEETPLWPLGLYRSTKIGAEREVEDALRRGLATVVLRPGQVFGERDGGVTRIALRRLSGGRPLLVDGGDGFCHPIYVENLVDGILTAATAPEAPGRIFNLADADLPWREFFGFYAAMVGRPLRSYPSWVVRLGTGVMESVAAITRRPARAIPAELGYLLRQSRYDTVRARSILGWVPRVSLVEAMARTEAWLRAAGHA